MKFGMNLLLFVLCSSVVFAAPVIDDVQGTFVDGQSITIFGAGFGVKSPVGPLLWDTVVNQPVYDGLSNGDVAPVYRDFYGNVVCPDCPWYGNSDIRYVDVPHLLFSDSVERVPNYGYYYLDTKGFFRGFDYGVNTPDQIYLSWYFRSTIPTAEWGMASSKVDRLLASEQCSGVECYDSYTILWGSHLYIATGGSGSVVNRGPAMNLNPNEWYRLEHMMDGRGLCGSMECEGGIVKVWKNGAILHDTTFGGFTPANDVSIFGFDPSVTDPYIDDRIFFGEVYIDGTQARLELCDVSSWSLKEQNGAHCEIQIPHTTWNDNNIQFTVNTGSFTQQEIDAGLFLFVVDENGVVSDGYELNQAPVISPTIYSVSDNTLSDGQSITISGAGFGSQGPSIQIFDDFEGGNNNEPINSVAVFGIWDRVDGEGSSPGTYYSDSSSVSGDLAFRANEDYGRNGLTKFFPDATEVFATWWIRHEGTNWPGQSDGVINWKTVWMMETDGAGAEGTDITLPSSVTGSTWYTHGNRIPSNMIMYGVFGPWGHNIWRRVAYHVKFDHITGVGDAQFWTVAPGDIPWRKTFDVVDVPVVSAGHVYREIVMNGYAYNSPDSFPMFDDFYLATGPGAQARIEIGNNRVYEQNTNLAIFIPTSWSASALSATVNQGSFTSSDDVYLFVVDADGVVSDGFGPLHFDESIVGVCTDTDNDGYNVSGVGCGLVDCHDSNPAIFPGAVEQCGNGIDEDCNGSDLACGPGDLDGNGVVDLRDLSRVASIRQLLLIGRNLF